jgi:Tfp pilus assembly protein PilO
MANVRQLRRGFGITIALLVGVSIAAVAVRFSAFGDPERAEAQAKRVHDQLQAAMHQAIPLDNIDEKIKSAQKQIAAFYEQRLPARESDVAAELGRMAQDSGIKLGNVRYAHPEATELADLDKMEVDLSLAGDYRKIVEFINSLERDKTFFILDRISLAEQQGGLVRLELHLETYLRHTAAPAAT